jgi:hypothetical protein
MRRRIVIAVVLLHVVMLWLLLAGFRTRLDPPQAELQFVSLWVDPPAPDEPPPPPTPSQRPPPQSRATPRADTPPRQPSVEPQRTAPLTTPVEPVPESTAPAAISEPQVDWEAAKNLAARRAGEALGAPKAPEPFSEGPKNVIPKPCKPRKRSMEWADESDTPPSKPGVQWVGPFPVLVTKRCAITIGFFGCNLGYLPEPNGHLLDDMKDPERSRSSVPDPKICD